MPIVFEAPQPFAPQISAGYGAAEQTSRDLPTIAGLYGQAAGIAQRANADAADNQYRNAASLGQQRLQASEFQAQQEAQARQFDLNRQVAVEHANNQRFDQSLRLAEYQRAPEIQQRQFELRAELNNAELSQQENLRLKQLKEYQGAIDNDTSLSDEEKADLKLQVEAKVSPLAHRKAKAEVMLAEQHAKQFEQQALQREEVTRKNAALDAQGIKPVHIDLPDGTTATMIQTGYDSNGRPTYTQVKSEKPSKPEKPVTRFGDEHGIFSYSLAEKEAMAEANKAYPKDLDKEDPTNATRRADHFQKVIDRMQAEHARQNGAGSVPASPDRPAGGVPAAAIQSQLSKGDSFVEQVAASPNVPEGMKDQARMAVQNLQQILKDYGTTEPDKVPEDVRPNVLAAERVLVGVGALLPPTRKPVNPVLRSLGLGGVRDTLEQAKRK